MKYFLLNSIKRIKQYSQQLDAESVLSNKSWYVFSDTGEKIAFMFRSNAELLIIVNGKVSKGKWELLPNKTILIDIGSESYLYNSAFVENQFLALNLDGSNDCLIMIEEGLKNELALNSVDKIDNYLENKYIIQPELELKRKEEEEKKRKLEEPRRLQLKAEEEQLQRERSEIKDKEYFKGIKILSILTISLFVISALIILLISTFNFWLAIILYLCVPAFGLIFLPRIMNYYIPGFYDENEFTAGVIYGLLAVIYIITPIIFIP